MGCQATWREKVERVFGEGCSVGVGSAFHLLSVHHLLLLLLPCSGAFISIWGCHGDGTVDVMEKVQ